MRRPLAHDLLHASLCLVLAACGASTTPTPSPDLAVVPDASVDSSVAPPDQGMLPDVGPADVGPADTAPPPSWPTLDPADVKQRFDQLVTFTKSVMKQGQVPGAAVAVIVGGKLVHVEGIGVRRQGKPEPVTGDSLFALASTSKLFAGATAVALSQKGIVDLQQPIGTYFPQLNLVDAGHGKQLTLHQLLSHTSGLGYADESQLYTLPIDWSAEQSIVEIFTKVPWPIWAPPGAVWNYNNAGYSLAGAVLQLAAGKGYADLVKDEVLTPLGMSTASLNAAEVQAAEHTFGHSPGESPISPSKDLIDYFSGPSNWVFCSAKELARLAEVVIAGGGPAPLTAGGVKLLTAPHASLEHLFEGNAYGYGLERLVRHGVETVGHAGSNWGWTADMVLVPSQGMGFIALMNSGAGEPYEVTDMAVQLFAQGTSKSPSPPPLSAAELAALAGEYKVAGELGDITVKAASGGLSLTFANHDETIPFHQYGVRAFYGQLSQKMSQALYGMPGIDVAFYVDQQGNGQYLVTRIGVGTRKP